MQFEDLKNDRAMLIALKDKDQFVAFSYFLHYQDCAYYGSADDDPDYESKIPLEHCIIWSAIEYYKKRRVDFLEIGVQQFGTQFFDYPSQKDLNISFFKRGFGGKIIPFYRGIKYYDTEIMKQNLECNMNRLLRAHQGEYSGILASCFTLPSSDFLAMCCQKSCHVTYEIIELHCFVETTKK